MDLVPQLPRPTGRLSPLWKSRADFFRTFRSTAVAESSSVGGENIAPLFDPESHHSYDDEDGPELRQLNHALGVLVEVFPDVQADTLREMLMNVSEESRIEVVTEALLKNSAKGAETSWRAGPNTSRSNITISQRKSEIHDKGQRVLNIEETFRSDAYRKAVKQVFYQEFKSLSHSSIKAVLAEQNYSYTLSRPVLQQLKSRSWRFSLSSIPNFWMRRAASQQNFADDHPFISQLPGAGAAVKRTGSTQLDRELYELFAEPLVKRRKHEQLTKDYDLAEKLNEEEAAQAQALFECVCCYNSVPFEHITACDQGFHQLCFDCVQRTVHEAVYGQGWNRTVSLERNTVRCFAPGEDCDGSIPQDQVRQALTADPRKNASPERQNDNIWVTFQSRLSAAILLKSGLSFHHCPQCSYAEVDDSSERSPTLIFPFSFPILHLLLTSLLALISLLIPVDEILKSAYQRTIRRRRGLRFRCQSCNYISCLRCLSVWQDPHVCFSTTLTSLRTTLESSATQAIKRTCPKCHLSFVKSSGCNKLVCNCGYTMCYICRQEISAREGYAHFCQHFRPNGGRCIECERCDLYGDEDEEKAIKRAVEVAEREWREREGMKCAPGDKEKLIFEAFVGHAARRERWWETWVDKIVDIIVVE
ncbi:hypothetical protein M433DRAFT_158770 [Acidomyces richmondensis BFW]|nr:MAG: hypothetical protein FE78DRAFT_86183 [Acidomyces sp. 'richmondensis']KYG41670.1 hypothetical protein M433DRAFT_158770 [Acidomyces richmondensis BFW]